MTISHKPSRFGHEPFKKVYSTLSPKAEANSKKMHVDSRISPFSSRTVTSFKKRKHATSEMQNFGEQRGHFAGTESFLQVAFHAADECGFLTWSHRQQLARPVSHSSIPAAYRSILFFFFFCEAEAINRSMHACTCGISQALQCTVLAKPRKQHARSQPPDAHCASPLRSTPRFLVAGQARTC